MWSKIASFILRNRLFLIITLGLVTIFMGYKASQVQLLYEMQKMIPSDDPDYIDFQNFKGNFGEDGSVMVIGVKSDKLFTLEFFNDWYDLSKDISNIEGIQQLLSITQLYNLEKDVANGVFRTPNVVTKKPTTQAELDSLKEEILKLEFYKGIIIQPDSGVTLIAATLDKSVLNTKSRVGLIDEIVTVVDKFGKKHDVELHYSGLPYIRTVFSDKVGNELKFFTFLAMFVTAIILLLFFRSFYVTIISLGVVFISAVWSVGFVELFGYKVSILIGLIPPLIVVIGIPNCIYLINKYHDEYRKHNNKVKALSRIISKIGLAVLYTNLTTSIGFGVFYFTGSTILESFGLVAFVSIMSIFVVSLILIPIVFSYLPSPTYKQTKHLDGKFLEKIVDLFHFLVFNHRRKIYIGTALILCVAGYGISKVQSLGYILDDIPQRDKLYKDLKFFEREFKGVMPFEIVVKTGVPGGVNKLETLNKMDLLQRKLSAYPELAKPISVVELMKFANQAYKNGNPKAYRLPTLFDIGKIMNYMPEKKEGQRDFTQSLVDSNYSTARISFQMKDVGSKEIVELKERVRRDIDSVFNSDLDAAGEGSGIKYDVDITGTSVINYKGNDYLIHSLRNSLLLAFVLISLIMASLFWSWKMVLVSLLPNTIPLLITLGVMGLFDVKLKVSTVLIFSVAFGIAVDFTIHFLAKYRHELKLTNYDMRKSVSSAMKETGVSMVYTSVVLFCGFVLFTASTFGGTVALGALTSITLVVALFSNLLVLPSFLLSLDKRINAKKAFEGAIVDLESDEDEVDEKPKDDLTNKEEKE